ncbi:hypothetical protein BJ912DRAFT_947914 [Pholiota molesta]|nr:hypothetical protein BJ912DRAFT_947914 [Pholiota molesta]
MSRSFCGPPLGYDLGERDVSVSSSTTAFKEALYERDVFFGLPRCVICGDSTEIYNESWPIVRDLHPWTDLKERGWIPPHAKAHPNHEPRNSLVMCITHRTAFKAHRFFIRFFPSFQKFVFMRIRGYWPFRPVAPFIPHDIPWQDWIVSAGAFDDAAGAFKRDFPACGSVLPQPARRDADMDTTPGMERQAQLPVLSAKGVDDILVVQRAAPSWRACEREGTSWTGTADENTHKYVSSIGVDDRQHGSRSPAEETRGIDAAAKN